MVGSMSPCRHRHPSKAEDVRKIHKLRPIVNFDSQIKFRKIKEKCVSVGAYGSLLNPGRDCGEDIQCITQKCKEGQCLGLIENENCNSHKDCQAGSYCRIAINWPFRGLCSRQKGSFEACTSDFECQNHMYCWYPSPSDRARNTSKCMQMYSQPENTLFGWLQVSSTDNSRVVLQDYEKNGKYCESGLAYPINDTAARCTSMNSMRYKGAVIPEPFPCDPTSLGVPCQIQFNINENDKTYTAVGTRGYVNVPCKCSFGGINDPPGFCSSIIGHEKYQTAVKELANVLSASKCHSLDRDNMRAQKDGCGIGTESDRWRMAIDKMFNVTYWPYVQVSTAYNCISLFFADSYFNLKLNAGQYLRTGLLALGAVSVLAYM